MKKQLDFAHVTFRDINKTKLEAFTWLEGTASVMVNENMFFIETQAQAEDIAAAFLRLAKAFEDAKPKQLTLGDLKDGEWFRVCASGKIFNLEIAHLVGHLGKSSVRTLNNDNFSMSRDTPVTRVKATFEDVTE